MDTITPAALPTMNADMVQKDVVFTEAMLLIGIYLSGVLSASITAPPGVPVDGTAYIIPADSTAEWAGRQGQIAIYYSGYRYIDPFPGRPLWVADEDEFWVYDTEDGWGPLTAGGGGPATINTRSGNYTLQLGDHLNTIVEMDVAAANSLTIPPHADVAFPVGAAMPIVQIGNGQTSIVPGDDVEILSDEGMLNLKGPGSRVELYQRAIDQWVLSGGLTASATGDAFIFVLAGQSNARGYASTTGGLPAYLAGPMPGVHIWNIASQAWEIYEATDNSDTLTSGAITPQAWGPEAEFARQFRAANPGTEVYILKYGVDSSPMSPDGPEDCWLPSAGELFADLKTQLDAAKADIIAGGKNPVVSAILFMQGEEDAEEVTESADYEDNLTEFITEARVQWGTEDTQVILGRILDRRTYSNVVRAAQQDVAAAVDGVQWFNTDFYPQNSDTRHYSNPGLVALGYDFFHVFNGTYPAPELPAPTWSNVKLMAGFNDADGATSYVEESTAARVATFTGNAQLDTAQAIYGSAALLLDGSGDGLSFPDSADFHLAAGVFRLDFSVLFNDVSSPTSALVNQWDSGASQKALAIARSSGVDLQVAYSTDGSTTVVAFAPEFYPVVGQKYHFALERDASNNLRLKQDGILIAKTNLGSASLFNSSAPLRFGFLTGFSAYDFNGVIDEARLVTGEVLDGSDDRYTVNVAEFPRS